MIHYTVTYVEDARDQLALIWLAAQDRSAVANADNEIDRVLCEDAQRMGTEVHEGLRQLVVPPLKVQFTVEEDDRRVTIWSVRHVGELIDDR
jgi:plasmid stabilization system protein ParE